MQYFAREQMFCENMQSFSEERDTFVRECKVSWRNAILLQGNTNVLRENTTFQGNIILLQENAIISPKILPNVYIYSIYI